MHPRSHIPTLLEPDKLSLVRFLMVKLCEFFKFPALSSSLMAMGRDLGGTSAGIGVLIPTPGNCLTALLGH